ncbi:MAG: hypothetical protein IT454_08000 [Planctomycetes bacterium]|nr:hypothetical protein [Planctomycetota bacterium]
MSMLRWVTYLGPGLLTVQIPDDFELHARPAVLIARVVQHHGTPVELDIDGRACLPGSIIDLLIHFHSAGHARQLVFRGPDSTLRDLCALFEHDLGERGLSAMPPELDFLRRLGDGGEHEA